MKLYIVGTCERCGNEDSIHTGSGLCPACETLEDDGAPKTPPLKTITFEDEEIRILQMCIETEENAMDTEDILKYGDRLRGLIDKING